MTLDNKKFGTHQFTITPIDGQEATFAVESTARYRYKLLFVTAYSYDHKVSEVWQHQCLTELRSTTVEDGEDSRLHSQKIDGALTLSISGSESYKETISSNCPGTFAYWSLAQLKRDRLINTQTGRAELATLAPVGDARWADQECSQYRLSTPDTGDINLWYRKGDDRWLGMQLDVDGRTITYLPDK